MAFVVQPSSRILRAGSSKVTEDVEEEQDGYEEEVHKENADLNLVVFCWKVDNPG